MAAIFLSWNPHSSAGWPRPYPAVRAAVETAGFFAARWALGGHHRDLAAGMSAWLLVDGRLERGLLGHGVVRHSVAADAVAAGWVDVDFDALLPRGEHIPLPVLRERIPGVHWEAAAPSGSIVPPGAERALRMLWAEQLPLPEADPTLPPPGSVPQAALTRVAANRYERDPQARRECLAARGTHCAACGFDFEAAYGELGAGFIAVHHIVPPSQLDDGYALDPLTDLVPLCANCHAIIHRSPEGVLTVAQLRRLLARGGQLRPGHVQGRTLSGPELEAQERAARILGPESDR